MVLPRLKISFPPATGYNQPWTSTVNSGTGVLKYCIAFLPLFTQETNGLYSGEGAPSTLPFQRAFKYHYHQTWPLFAVTSCPRYNIGYKRETGDTKFQIYIYVVMGSLTLYNIVLTPRLRLRLSIQTIFFFVI